MDSRRLARTRNRVRPTAAARTRQEKHVRLACVRLKAGRGSMLVSGGGNHEAHRSLLLCTEMCWRYPFHRCYHTPDNIVIPTDGRAMFGTKQTEWGVNYMQTASLVPRTGQTPVKVPALSSNCLSRPTSGERSLLSTVEIHKGNRHARSGTERCVGHSPYGWVTQDAHLLLCL